MAHYEVRRKRIEPLWDRVDRNRVRLALFLAMFFLATTLSLGLFVALAVLIGAVFVVGSMAEAGMWMSVESFGAVLTWAFAGSGVGVLVYMMWALSRDERWFARRLGATLAPKGELLQTKYALKDMAIASGFEVAPALYVIETPNVNAFVYQRGHRRAVVGVTRGLTSRLTSDEQRGVFANLMARLQQGDMLWASAVTALMSPLWRMRDKQIDANEQLLFGDDSRPVLDRPGGEFYVSSIEVYGVAILTLFTVISEFLAFGHRSSQLKHAETADAEGMLLLKDPLPMLSAIEKSVRFNNFVPTAGPGMTQLFYAWTGECSTDDEEDPEMRRVTRLREVLGVEGMALPEPARNESTFLVAPPAPRLEK